jgi:hypothetical protein
VASSPLQSVRRSRRIASIPRNNIVAGHVDEGNSSADEIDENESSDTDNNYSSKEDDERESDKNEECEIRFLEKDVENKVSERVATIIPHERLRPLGGVEYADYKVHGNTLLYLKDLRANNKRAWFKSKK